MLAAALLALATAPAAVADVTFGSALEAPPGSIARFNCAGTGGCTLGLQAIPGRQTAAPIAGVLTRWRIQTGPATTPVRLQVVRTPASDPLQRFVVAESAG